MKPLRRVIAMTALVVVSSVSFAAPHSSIDLAYPKLFSAYDACFMLYDLNQQKMVSEYNPNNRCSERLAPNSTFKVALSLMAFDQGLINQNTVFKWDGVKRELPNWNQDQTPQSWLQNSALWVSQGMAPQLGMAKIKQYLAGFHYGNQDFSGDPGQNNGLTQAWLSGSLRISAVEQMAFLQAMLLKQLPVSSQAVADTKHNMYLGKLKNGAEYYGKTGAGRHKMRETDSKPSQLRDGWFVGFIEKGAQRYIFVSNLTDRQVPKPGFSTAGSMTLKPITLQLLDDYFGQ